MFFIRFLPPHALPPSPLLPSPPPALLPSLSEYLRKGLPKKKPKLDITVPVPLGIQAAAAGGVGVAGGMGGGVVSVGAAVIHTTKVGLVKRDRRTTEEVQLEIKRRKG